MTTADMMALAALNFASVFAAVAILNAMARRRSRRAAEVVMESIGRQIMTDQAFTQIVRENFQEPTEGDGL